jgi:hypothetical protein
MAVSGIIKGESSDSLIESKNSARANVLTLDQGVMCSFRRKWTFAAPYFRVSSFSKVSSNSESVPDSVSTTQIAPGAIQPASRSAVRAGAARPAL